MASIPKMSPEEVQQSLNWQLIGAIRALDVDRAIRHIKEGADVHAKTFGTTALAAACGGSFPELALYILAIPGINVNATGDNGWTALCLAANTGLTTVVRVLLEKGADLNTICVGSPLYHACGKSHKEIAIRLIAAGADINAGAPNTPIFACGNRPEMAEVLAILNSPDPRAAAIKALLVSASAVPAPNKAELAQQLLRAVQTNNGEEITRLVAAGIRLQDLPKNINTQARLLNAITPRPVAAAAPKPVAGTGELKMIGGDVYFVQNGNVYEYDLLMESKGGFVGRLKADESINRNAKEVMSGGSRKTRSRRRSSKNRRTQLKSKSKSRRS
jgi:hypothetical protein